MEDRVVVVLDGVVSSEVELTCGLVLESREVESESRRVMLMRDGSVLNWRLED